MKLKFVFTTIKNNISTILKFRILIIIILSFIEIKNTTKTNQFIFKFSTAFY